MSTAAGRRPNPVVLAGIGLALMIAGWKLGEYVPAPAEPPAGEERQPEAKGVSAPRSGRRAVQNNPTPPYQGLGRVMVFGGLFLFIAGGVLMYQQTPPPSEPREEPPEGLEAEVDPQHRPEDGP